jgi:hypothetical protein
VREPSSNLPTILVIEDWAHLPSGHYPRRFAELAEAFAALGWHAEVLTSRGWLHETDTGTSPFAVSRYGFLAGVFDRVATRLQKVYRETRAGTAARTIGSMLRVTAMVGAARSLRRRTAGAPTAVVVLSYGIDIVLASAIAATSEKRSLKCCSGDTLPRALKAYP